MLLFQGIDGPITFGKVARPGDGLKIHGEVTEVTKRGFVGNVNVENFKEEKIAEIIGLKAVVVSKGIAKRLFKV